MSSVIKFSFILFFITCSLNAQDKYNSVAGKSGAFSRLGFGPRGMAMGNALTSVNSGNLVSYYNPALSPFQNDNSFSAGYSFLSLDRTLNFVSFTRKFTFGGKLDSSGKPGRSSTAGLSIGLINAGVSNIDQRDNQGIKIGDISTSENLIFVGLSNKFSEKFSIGVNIRFYYYSLYEDITSNALGFDVGLIYLPIENLTIGFVISDINAKYEWDTTPIYEEQGTNTTYNFPLNKKIAVAYNFTFLNLITAAEYQFSNEGDALLRLGAEYQIYSNLFLRGGIDNLILGNLDIPSKPSLGFGYSYSSFGIMFGIEYAFVFEPYSDFDQQVIGLNVLF